MFPKTQRMTRREFSYVFKNGVHSHSALFHIIKYPTADGHKAAVVVSKKIYKTAVSRNRLRRRLYAALREVFEAAPQQAAVIVIAKQPSQECSYNELVAALKKQLGQNTKTHIGRTR